MPIVFEKLASDVTSQALPNYESSLGGSLSYPPAPTDRLFYYQAYVPSVADGNTITVDIDHGFQFWTHGEKIRLLRINAPELQGDRCKEGEAARDYLQNLTANKQVFLEVFEDDKEKYGRYFAEVWLQTNASDWLNVNDQIVRAGHAEYHPY